jgi:protein phosphatase
MVVVESSGITDVGRRRESNEDSLFVNDDMGLYLVADGMGGHQAGEVASRIVVDSIRDYMMEFREKTIDEKIKDIDKIQSEEAKHLFAAVHHANSKVHQLSVSNESYKGMGSTVSAIYFTDSTLIAINVGDSPIYLIRKGDIKTISVFHTMMAELAAMAPKKAEPLGMQYRHMLTRAMGVNQTVKPDICELDVFEGDTLVISSDGLSDKVSPEEILDVVNKETPDKACRLLVDQANERGGEDNITVIVLNIKNIIGDVSQPAIEKIEIEVETEASPGKPQIAVDYDTEDGSYRSFIQEINDDGVFIETRESFYVGQDVLLTFAMDDNSSFMITGKVGNREPEGIDVKFEDLSQQEQDMIKTLKEKMKPG